jgi:hypothetical protein
VEDPDRPTADANLLARMLELKSADQPHWDAEDLEGILEHQLAAPLEADLADLRPGLRRRLAELGAAGGPPIATFRDLLEHPRPPLELLELTKRFAKRCRSNPDAPLPDDIATVLYLAAIAAAMTRCATRITGLGDEGMRHGLRWALGRPWLDASTRKLLQRGSVAGTRRVPSAAATQGRDRPGPSLPRHTCSPLGGRHTACACYVTARRPWGGLLRSAWRGSARRGRPSSRRGRSGAG